MQNVWDMGLHLDKATDNWQLTLVCKSWDNFKEDGEVVKYSIPIIMLRKFVKLAQEHDFMKNEYPYHWEDFSTFRKVIPC